MKSYATDFHLRVLVETGTCFGDAVAEVRDAFDEIYSIELSSELHEGAKKRFVDDPNVHLFLGDSAVVLPALLPRLPMKNLFWLDAHYSGGVTVRGPVSTPILQEVEAIFSMRPHGVVLIDDADCFTGTNGYPELRYLEDFIRDKAHISVLGLAFVVEGNIIRVYETSPNL